MDRVSLDSLAGLAADGASQPELRLDLHDRIGEWFVLYPSIQAIVDGRKVATTPLTQTDGLVIDVTQGSAETRTDPYTGYTLLRPTGTEPVEAVATLRREDLGVAAATAPQRVGYSIQNLPDAEMLFNKAGGGACAALVTGLTDITLEVRAAVLSNVMPVSPTERVLVWRHGLYYASDPVAGFMRLTYNPDYMSRMVLAGGEESFFPARATNELYFLLEFVDLGVTAFNPEPMRQVVDLQWPLFEEAVLGIESPVEFYDVEDPSKLIMTLQHQEMRLYDYQSLTVEVLNRVVDPAGVMTLTWRVTNQAQEAVRSRWFLLGDFTSTGMPTEGSRLLGAAGTRDATWTGTTQIAVPKSTLPQQLTVAAVTVAGPVLAGVAAIEFQNPAPLTDRAAWLVQE